MSNYDSDDELAKLFRSLKAEHPLPSTVKQRIMRQATRSASQNNWRSWWYFSQFALGCAALVLVLSWVNPAKLPAYYQIDTITRSANTNSAAVKEQWHHLTAFTAASLDNKTVDKKTVDTGLMAKTMVQQRLTILQDQQRQLQYSGELNNTLPRQVGLLIQHDNLWQIALCDNMQLNVAIELVQALDSLKQFKPMIKPQWVELQFASTGHILAITAVTATATDNQCLSSSLPVWQHQS